MNYYMTSKRNDPFINYFNAEPKEGISPILLRSLDENYIAKRISEVTNSDEDAFILCSSDLSEYFAKNDLLSKISNNLETNYSIGIIPEDDGQHHINFCPIKI